MFSNLYIFTALQIELMDSAEASGNNYFNQLIFLFIYKRAHKLVLKFIRERKSVAQFIRA